MKEIVLVTLATDAKTGTIIPDAPFWSAPLAPIAAASTIEGPARIEWVAGT